MARQARSEKKKGTGLVDSSGEEICFGDLLAIETGSRIDQARETHGDWVMFEVENRGCIPCLYYVRSEKGEIFPQRYTARLLSDLYARKDICFRVDVGSMKPLDWVQVVGEASKKVMWETLNWRRGTDDVR